MVGRSAVADPLGATHLRVMDRLRQILNLVLIPLGIVLAFTPFTAANVGDSATRGPDPALVAAGYAFSIWSLIFLWQLVYAVWQVLPAQRTRPALRSAGWWTALNGALNGAWSLAVVNDQQTLSWLLIVGMLGVLIAVERATWRSAPLTVQEHWLLRVPYGVNLGWISVATLLSTSIFLQNEVGWNGAPLTPEAWGAILVVVAAALALASLLWRRGFAFALTLIWALVAIAVGTRADAPGIALTAAVAALLVGVGTAAAWVRRDRLPTPGSKAKGSRKGRAPSASGR